MRINPDLQNFAGSSWINWDNNCFVFHCSISGRNVRDTVTTKPSTRIQDKKFRYLMVDEQTSQSNALGQDTSNSDSIAVGDDYNFSFARQGNGSPGSGNIITVDYISTNGPIPYLVYPPPISISS
jgi:hypothetical protein